MRLLADRAFVSSPRSVVIDTPQEVGTPIGLFLSLTRIITIQGAGRPDSPGRPLIN